MGAKAVHDLWGQTLLFEARHGDRAPQIVAKKAELLRKAGDMIEADFWSQVADCLTDLHRIRYGYPHPKDSAGDAASLPGTSVPGNRPSS